VLPAPDGGVSRSAINRAIPAFHRMNAEAVTDLLTIKRDWLSERTLAAGLNFAVAGNGQSQAFDVGLEVRDVSDTANWCVGPFFIRRLRRLRESS
jgi:hypothetical protein